MKRRTFLGLAGAAAVFPRVALGQAAKVPRIAFLSIPTSSANWDRVVRDLADLGWVNGRTVTLEQYTAPTTNDVPAVAARALLANPDVIMTLGTPTTLAAKGLTATTPIVFNAGAPVETRLVASLAHPGGNVTGVTPIPSELAGKQLGVLKEAIPTVRRLAIPNLPVDPAVQSITNAAVAAAPALGLVPVVIDFDDGKGFVEQLQGLHRANVDAVFVSTSIYLNANRDVLFDFELNTRLPLFWGAIGQPFYGVLGYAANSDNMYQRWVAMVDGILKGVKPADIPVAQATLYDLAINLKTARALGITIPPSVLAQATIVTE